MFLIRDFPIDGSIIVSDSPIIRVARFIAVPELAIAMIVDVVVIVALIKQQDIPIDIKFIISLTAADSLFSLLFFVIGTGEVIFDGWWIGGKSGCMWSQILFIYTLRCSILSMFAMTFHRYMIVIHSYHLSQKKVYAIIGSIWLGMALSIGLFAASQSQDTAIGLQASKLYCYLAMDSTETHNIISSSFVIFVLLVTMLFLVFAYYSIVKRYIDMKAMAAKKKNGESGKSPIQKIAEPPADGRANEITIINRLGENEIKVIKKAIAISGSFSAVWTFFVGKSIFEMVCHQEVSSYYDIFTVLLYAANPIVNGIILYLYDAKCRKNINELFYYKTLVSILESKRRKRTLVKPQKADIGQIKLVNLNIANAGEVSTLQQGSFTVSTVKMYS